MFKKLTLGIAGLALVGLALVPSLPAQAHAASNYYGSPYIWNNNTNINVYYQNTSSKDDAFWGNLSRGSLAAAIDAWNNAGDSAAPHFVYQGQTTDSSPCSGNPTRVVVEYTPFTGGELGQADGRVQPTYPSTWPCLQIAIQDAGSFPQGEGWQKDCSDTGPNDHSLCGVITHELGHVTGFGLDTGDDEHFFDNAACPNNSWSTFNTMCYGWTVLGQQYKMFSLESHDIHTLNNEYPH